MRYSFIKLGDTHKLYEKQYQTRLVKSLPIVCRLDGKSFSKWTKGLKYPYDERLQFIREECMKFLVTQLNAVIAYSQSDEFTIIMYNDNPNSELYFGGNINKLNSVIASMLTAKFNALVQTYIPEKADKLAFFDCRTYQVPTLKDAAESLVWREMDCTKNSISMLAHAHFSHKQLQHKKRNEMLDMLHNEGINWNTCPAWFKRGSYVKKVQVEKELSSELERLLKNKAGVIVPKLVKRSEAQVVELPITTSLQTDKLVDLIFNKELIDEKILTENDSDTSSA